MTMPALTLLDVGIAALLLAINGAVSIALRLGLEKSLAVATVRMIVQLSLVGLVLRFVFAETSLLWTLGVALVMLGVAAYEVAARQTPRFTGWMTQGLGGGVVALVSVLATCFAVGVVMRNGGGRGLFEPRFFLPILGMVLGNTLTAVSLALSTLIDLAQRERRSIEAQLAQGATIREAFGAIVRPTLRTALLPMINAMSVAGVVTLPGMMTGQILAGVDPLEAARYQIMILCVIAGAAALGAVAATLGGVRLLSDQRMRLRLDRLAASEPGRAS